MTLDYMIAHHWELYFNGNTASKRESEAQITLLEKVRTCLVSLILNRKVL